MPGEVRILLFGPARAAVGRPALDRALGPALGTVGDVVDGLGDEFPALRPVLRTSRFALNGRYGADRATRLVDGDELAVHPPYSGG